MISEVIELCGATASNKKHFSQRVFTVTISDIDASGKDIFLD